MEEFLDYYELLQISPHAEFQTISRVYKMLATRYHPDNPTTGNQETFLQLQAVYETLSDPARRAAYDADREVRKAQPMQEFAMPEFFEGVEAENNRRLGILCLLYNQRRLTPERPAISLFEMEARMAIPREHLEFATWYLRERSLLLRRDGGDLLITADGVDFVESKNPGNHVVAKLLKMAPLDPVNGTGG
jgi:curved DNA-binding protein CbpA